MVAQLVGGNKTHIKIEAKFIRAIVYENKRKFWKTNKIYYPSLLGIRAMELDQVKFRIVSQRIQFIF